MTSTTPTTRTTLTTSHHASETDYSDAMVLTLPEPTGRPAIDWAREIIEQSPVWVRQGLPPGWRVLGMRLAPTHAPDHVHGWPVIVETPQQVVLGAPSRLGFDARLSVEVDGATVRFSTAIRHGGRFSRRLWTAIGLLHRTIVGHMMRHAAAA